MNSTDNLKGSSRLMQQVRDTKFIGITGKARSGKDTVGEMLSQNLSIATDSFAQPIKDMLKAGLGLEDKALRAEALYTKNYRQLVQTLGTEWGREMVCDSIWLEAMLSRRLGLKTIITDVRFENEAELIRQYGTLIHVVRFNQEEIEESDHRSEDGIAEKEGDIIIYNDSSLEILKEKVAQWTNHL